MRWSSVVGGVGGVVGLLGAVLGCGSGSATDSASGAEVVGADAPACDATLGGSKLDLECQHKAAGASATTCVYARAKPYYTIVGHGADEALSGLGSLDGSRRDVILIGGGFGRPLTITGGIHALNDDRSVFSVEESTFSLKSVKNLDQVWDSADVLLGLDIEFYMLEQDPAVQAATTTEARAAALAAVTRKKRDQTLAQCVSNGLDEKTCKESTVLVALWTAHKIVTEADLRSVADVDKKVTVAVPFACRRP